MEFPINRAVISSLVDGLDELLCHGGIISGILTEVVGKAKSGKTSLALQACLSVELPNCVGGVDGDSIYIGSNNVIERYSQMAAEFIEFWNKRIMAKDPEEHLLDMDGIMNTTRMFHCDTLDSIRQKIFEVPEMIKSNRYIKLVVIDGIGNPFGNVEDNVMFKERAEAFRETIMNLVNNYNVAVIVTNQKNVKELYSGMYFTPIFANRYATWYPSAQMIQMSYVPVFNSGVIRIVRTSITPEGETWFKINDGGIIDE